LVNPEQTARADEFQVAGPDREGPGAVVDALEAGAERVRDHLRRLNRPDQRLNPSTPVTPSIGQSRRFCGSCSRRSWSAWPSRGCSSRCRASGTNVPES